MNSKKIHPNDLEEGPLRQAELPTALIARIKYIHRSLEEVYPSSLNDWLDEFQRDVHPEQEVVWWESLAR